MEFYLFRPKMSETRKTFYQNLLIDGLILVWIRFLFPCFQHVESFVDFLSEISIVIQHPCQLAILLLQQHASELSSLDSVDLDNLWKQFQTQQLLLFLAREVGQLAQPFNQGRAGGRKKKLSKQTESLWLLH